MKRTGPWLLLLVAVLTMAVPARRWLERTLNREPPAPRPYTERAATSDALPDEATLPGYLRNARQKNLLVFIHGFNSSARDAWQHASGAFWPTVFQNDGRFDAFDVYVAEYPTCTANRPNAGLPRLHTWIQDNLQMAGAFHYERIVIIAHSMGGLVTRAMLLGDAVRQVRPKIVSVFFLGTPGLGTAKADAAAWISGRCGAEQAENLETNSGYIQVTSEFWREWLKTAPPPDLGCVAEGKAYRGLSTLGPIVSRTSAASNCGSEAELFADRDHFGIAKVSGRDDPIHAWVSARMLRALPAAALSASLPVWAPPVAEPPPMSALPGSSGKTAAAKARTPAQAELLVNIAFAAPAGQGWTRRGHATDRITLGQREGAAGAQRFEGEATLRVTNGRLTNFSARCIAHCGTPPSDAASSSADNPGFGQQARWMGLRDAGDPRRGGAAITHWRTEPGLSPEWEVRADHEVPSAQQRAIAERVWVTDSDSFRVEVPVGATLATAELMGPWGTHGTFDLSAGIPADAPLRAVRTEKTASGVVYWLRWLAQDR